MKELRDLITDYLRQAKLMQLATVVNDKPWVCNVWFAFDSNLNLYWFSSTTRRHSDELTKNQNVAGAIASPQTPEDHPRGVQFEGVAEMLTLKEDIDHAISLYKNRIFPIEKINALMNSKERPHKFYRIKPKLYVLFDAVNFPQNARQELSL